MKASGKSCKCFIKVKVRKIFTLFISCHKHPTGCWWCLTITAFYIMTRLQIRQKFQLCTIQLKYLNRSNISCWKRKHVNWFCQRCVWHTASLIFGKGTYHWLELPILKSLSPKTCSSFFEDTIHDKIELWTKTQILFMCTQHWMKGSVRASSDFS